MNTLLSLLFLTFVIGDCVQITQKVWWSYRDWTIIGIDKDGYTLYDGEWTVHSVPAKMLKKCKK